jgi:hypothetical protein
MKDEQRHTPVDWARLGIVAAILIVAILTNVTINLAFKDLADRFPFIGVSVWVVILLATPLRKPQWDLVPEAFKGTIFLLALVTCASLMPVEKLPAATWQSAFTLGFVSAGLRQHSAHGPRVAAGRVRLGHARLCSRLRRLDDLVRLVGRRRAVEHVPRCQERGPLDLSRMACDGRLRDRFLRVSRARGLAPDAQARRPAAVPARRAATRLAALAADTSEKGNLMDPMQWLTLIVFGLTIVAVITNVIDATLAALIGVAVMCWLGIMTEADAFKYVDWNVMAILLGIWIIAGYFGKSGVPSWLSIQALKLSGGRPAFSSSSSRFSRASSRCSWTTS